MSASQTQSRAIGEAPRSAASSRSSRPRRTSTRARRARSRTSVREAVEQWLAGWDANGAEWDFWVERNEAFRTAVAAVLHAEADDVAVTTSVSQGVSALVSALPLDGEPEPDRDQRVRVPDRRADRARAGAPRRRGRPRAARRGRRDPARALRGGDRRADGARLLHDALLPLGPPPRRRRDRRGRHAAGALVLADSYQACGAVELDVRRLGADVVTGGTVKYLLGTAGLGFMWVRPEVLRSPPPDADRLVRRRGHLRDVDRRLLAPRERPALRLGDAARARALRGRRRAVARRGGRRRRDRGARARLADRLLDGLDASSARRSRPRATRAPGPLVCVRSTDVNALVAALAAERIVVSLREDKLRVALHLYNVEEDVDRLLDALPPPRAARLTARAIW